jgi:hypothetical protein
VVWDRPFKSRPAKTQLVLYTVAAACALISLLCFAVPMYVIRPFRPQGPHEFPLAMAIRQAGPVVSALCVVFSVVVLLRAWPQTRAGSRTILTLCALLALAGAGLTRINIFEIMFHPYASPEFEAADSIKLDNDDMVMSLTLGGETHAWPIRAIGYHHIVNDMVGGWPVAATYCTLCHTGIVWKRVIDGQVLTFRLTGIRNGNALLRDEETGTIWQQSTGMAIFGPLQGRHLELMHSDELTFAEWRNEQPRGLILKPDPEFAALYEKKDWEKVIGQDDSVIDTSKTGIAPRELMLGIAGNGGSKAFPWKAVLSAKLIQDRVGTDPVLVVMGSDNISVRAFRTDPSTTFLRPGSLANGLMIDMETSTVWNFSGCAVSGPRTGQCLQPLNPTKDYWFDWFNYHPSSEVFRG